MRVNVEQFIADKARMEQFICQHIPVDETTRIEFALGIWAHLYSTWDDDYGWFLHWETNEPDCVDLWLIYDHFRVQEMTWAEWRDQIDGRLARWKVHKLERDMAVLRRELDKASLTGDQDRVDANSTVDENGLPREVSTGEAARILGVSKDTVLRLKSAGLLEYRNTGTPDSCRPVFAFTLRSVLKLRTSYEQDIPMPRRPKESPRRRVKGERKYEHLRLTPD